MRVTIDIPDQVWWAATSQFEREHTTTKAEIETLLIDAARNAPRRRRGMKSTLRTPTPAQVEREAHRSEVINLVTLGRTDQEISVETGLTRATVGEIRRAAELAPNKPKKQSERTTA